MFPFFRMVSGSVGGKRWSGNSTHKLLQCGFEDPLAHLGVVLASSSRSKCGIMRSNR